jgi:hypothetical protein
MVLSRHNPFVSRDIWALGIDSLEEKVEIPIRSSQNSLSLHKGVILQAQLPKKRILGIRIV